MRTLIIVVCLGTAAAAQAPAFEAVSIRVNTSGENVSQFGGRPGSLQVRNNTLRNIIRNIWNITNSQIVGGPSWIDEERFDIVATAAGTPNRDEMIAMARHMLAERFKLVVHNEKRPTPIYALVLASSDRQLGPTMRRSKANCTPPTPPVAGGSPAPPPEALGGVDLPPCGTRVMNGTVAAAGRIIVDKTGLNGRFDLVLRFNPDPNNTSSDVPSLFAAVQEQLGLKLDSQTAPVDVLVIDSVEKPTEN